MRTDFSKFMALCLQTLSAKRVRFACGSSGAHASQLGLFCVISQKSHPLRLSLSHAQSTWPDRIPLPPSHSTPSLLYPLNGSIPCNPQHGVQFGGLAKQSPIADHRPVRFVVWLDSGSSAHQTQEAGVASENSASWCS